MTMEKTQSFLRCISGKKKGDCCDVMLVFRKIYFEKKTIKTSFQLFKDARPSFALLKLVPGTCFFAELHCFRFLLGIGIALLPLHPKSEIPNQRTQKRDQGHTSPECPRKNAQQQSTYRESGISFCNRVT